MRGYDDHGFITDLSRLCLPLVKKLYTVELERFDKVARPACRPDNQNADARLYGMVVEILLGTVAPDSVCAKVTQTLNDPTLIGQKIVRHGFDGALWDGKRAASARSAAVSVYEWLCRAGFADAATGSGPDYVAGSTMIEVKTGLSEPDSYWADMIAYAALREERTRKLVIVNPTKGLAVEALLPAGVLVDARRILKDFRATARNNASHRKDNNMASIQPTTTITGRIAQVNVKELPSGATVMNATILYNDRRQDDDGEWYTHKTISFDVSVWGKKDDAKAVKFFKKFDKGDKVKVEGRIDDVNAFLRKTGEPGASIKVSAWANQIEFVD